jgi:CRP-like cAMP-binding protein
MLLILEGSVRLSRLAPSAEEIRLADTGAGTVVGEMAVLSPAPRSATATCLEETIVAWLSRDTLLERLVLEDPASGVVLRVCTEQVCDRLMAIRARVDLLRETLEGGDREFLSERLTKLVGGESGPLPDNLRKWLEGR